MADNKLFLTGFKPTGELHLGNFVGALKQSRDLSQENKMIVFIADLHALNAIHDAKMVHTYTYKVAAVLMSLGFNMDNILLFKQSDVDAVYKLTELLMNVTPKGLMDRAHSFMATVDLMSA